MTESHPQNRILGYARVSTYGQTLDAQLEQLRAAGCARVYREKATGAKAERRELQRMLMDFPPECGGVRSERHAACRMVIPAMLARASAGVR